MVIELGYNEIEASSEGLGLLEQFVGHLEGRINTSGVSQIILEGPPPYLEPLQPTHQWNNRAFVNGWKVLNSLRAGLAPTTVPVEHWLMIDDVHVSPELDLDDTWSRLNASGIISPADTTIMERAFREDMGDECTTMDSRFQLLKFRQGLVPVWEAVNSRNINLAQVALPVNIVIHPVAFQGQQAGMLPELLSGMKNDVNYAQIPKQRRREIVERSYMHIWLDDESGDIVSITQPHMNGGGFIHQSIFAQNGS